MNSILLKAFLFIACATFSYPIFAAQSETFQVSATIDTGCLINGALTGESNTQIGTIGELNFGEHSAIYAAEVEGSITYNGGLTLSCTPGIAMNIKIDGGLNASVGVRKLKHTEKSSTVDYLLFEDAEHSQVLDIDTPYSVGNNEDPDNIQVPIWAKAILNGNEIAGIYTDTLTLTLEW
ncbi:TPA: spore coat U domain-containing protein [Vibrio diabolicus]